MTVGKNVRMSKLWKHKCNFIIPFDHGAFSGVTPGLEDLKRLTERIARTDVDGILVTPGVLKQVSKYVGDLGLMIRMDGGFTRYSTGIVDYQELSSPEDVVRMGGDAGIVFTFVGTSVQTESIRRLGRTAAAADAWGLPLAAEILAPSLLNNHFGMELFGGANPDTDVDAETADVVRIGAESGADIIKTRYTGNKKAFRRMVRSCGVPVIVAGGPSLPGGAGRGESRGEATLQLASECVDSGAAGIIFGRNVWQHRSMEKLIRALCAVVHDGETVREAMKLLR